MSQLVILTGPIAVGKNTVADLLAGHLTAGGHTVVVADVDDVAAMVTGGAGRVGLWFAAHEVHGALVGEWLRSAIDYVVAVGPFWMPRERAALARSLPDGVDPLWVVLDAPVSVTMARAEADPGRGISREPGFHRRAHGRFRAQLPTMPADRTFDAEKLSAEQIAAAIAETLAARRPTA